MRIAVLSHTNRSNKGNPHRAGLVFLFNLTLAFLCIMWFPATATAQSEPMLTYKATHDLLPTDDIYSVRVYEDGSALIHYPVFMKKAGDYTVQLTPAEVQQLRLLLGHPLVQGFDSENLKAQKKQIDAQSSDLFAISDNTYSDFQIKVRGQTGNRQQIRWANLHIDAKRYPQIGIFRKLADIEASLMELDQHPTAQRVE